MNMTRGHEVDSGRSNREGERGVSIDKHLEELCCKWQQRSGSSWRECGYRFVVFFFQDGSFSSIVDKENDIKDKN